ncbi:MAG: hypothetical protein DI595_01185 [Agrobacterium fabrum]|uniref:Uncharacterized protein n=1 Tax=Agrobacterium fabrum TaxID=1176649 RepID=A0A2W5FDH0_9HYPH|nr:MAG: hypothetical protein DI595_01185 [Agrobacterium fabrum]
MMTLLHRLHTIAAQRGDGLRPELLRMISPSSTWSAIDDAARAASVSVESERSEQQQARDRLSAEIVVLPARPR